MEMYQSNQVHETGPNELLQTKLAIPRLHTAIVPRESLLSALDKGLEGKLTLLTAPAGFGKTTLVSTWATRSIAGVHVAWVALDEKDDDPVRFWRYVMTASQAFDKAAGQSSLKQLRLSQELNFEAILTVWINEISSVAGRNVLVLDDYHFIQSPQIHDQVTFLVDHLPATMHVVILSRSELPLPLARLRAQGELLELHGTDLQFSPEETRIFLQNVLTYSLPPETIAYLHERAEGWAAGLHLIAVMLRFKPDAKLRAQFLAEFSGSLRPILEYLVSDVLNTQAEGIQTFLLKTSFLNKLTGSLCDAVLGRTGSGEILMQLERANLFILPLDETRQWYHYHALFAEAMQYEAAQRYEQEAIHSIYRQASSWYERNGLLADAVEASLSAQDYPSAALLVQQLLKQENFTEARELYTLRRWLENMPEPVIHEHPELCFLYARVLLFTREQSTIQTPPRIEELLRSTERAWESQGNLAKLGEVLAFRAVTFLLRGAYAQAAASARQALTQLPKDDLRWRSIGLNSIALDDLIAGRLNAVDQTLPQSLQLCEMTGNPYAVRGTRILLGHTHSGRGELLRAAELYRQVLTSAQEDGDLTDQARALLGWAHLSYEWNDLAEAQQQAEQALEIGTQIRDETLRVQPALLLARISLARRRYVQSQQQIAAVLASLQPHRLPALYREALAAQAQLQLSAGNLGAVQQWVTNRNEIEAMLPVPQNEQEELLIARFLIQQAKSKAALNILNRLEIPAQEAGRIQTMLALRVVQALAHLADQDTTSAAHRLHEVLALACQEGYQRLFLDEGNVIVAPLQSLLPAVEENALIAPYLVSLLAAFAQQEQKSSGRTVPVDWVEPLTPQEERILILFASGNTKQEIAGKLFISTNTVKTHLKRVYQKLGIRSRAEARQIARRLDLLQ